MQIYYFLNLLFYSRRYYGYFCIKNSFRNIISISSFYLCFCLCLYILGLYLIKRSFVSSDIKVSPSFRLLQPFYLVLFVSAQFIIKKYLLAFYFCFYQQSPPPGGGTALQGNYYYKRSYKKYQVFFIQFNIKTTYACYFFFYPQLK